MTSLTEESLNFNRLLPVCESIQLADDEDALPASRQHHGIVRASQQLEPRRGARLRCCHAKSGA